MTLEWHNSELRHQMQMGTSKSAIVDQYLATYISETVYCARHGHGDYEMLTKTRSYSIERREFYFSCRLIYLRDRWIYRLRILYTGWTQQVTAYGWRIIPKGGEGRGQHFVSPFQPLTPAGDWLSCFVIFLTNEESLVKALVVCVTIYSPLVNASIEQRGEQRFQPHVEWFVERHAS